MSTFTDWNGPQGSGGARALDLIQLANAYSELVTKLNEHMNDRTPGTSDVHGIKTYVESQLAIVRGLIPSVDGLISEADADTKYQEKIANINDFVKTETLDSYATKQYVTTALSDYLKKNELSAQQVILDIQSDIDALELAISANPFKKPILKAAEYVEGLIHAVEQIQFTDKHYSAFVGGSDIRGVYYILGMLCDKAGTAYIRMGNTKPFSAIINFAVTPGWKGALSVTTDCELKGLVFKIVYGTDADGNAHAYLAIQSSEWFSQFASSDGVGLYSDIEFFGAGINFIPVNSAGWKRPNGSCHNICDCKSGKGFSFSELASVIMGKQIYREEGNPYVTVKDIKALDHVGVISQWTDYDDNGIAINVPEGYHACDGTPVLDTDDVSDEFRAKYTEYPLMDYSIIKTKSTIDIEEQEDTNYSLAEAVCVLHGIKFYTSIADLPDEAKVGEPVVVADGDKYTVYVYNDHDGWKKYSTTFNDINSTIGAVAAVIAAVHGADVYTVYNSVADLPTGPSVETGTLAIIFDDNYSVFKYNGTAWELQV